jgi:hypothetical protein
MTGLDIEPVTNLALPQLIDEVNEFSTVNRITSNHNLTLAVVNQFFSPLSDLASIATDDNGKILAFTVATNTEKPFWTNDKMVTVRIAHVDKTLPLTLKVKLIKDMLSLWEEFATLSQSNLICSNTTRIEQHGYLKLHEKHGYVLRGSFAFKKLA